MTPNERQQFVQSLSPEAVRHILYDWGFWARDGQWPPEGEWRVWIIMAGRGYGKTRAGAEWIRIKANAAKGQYIALVGETADDVRNVMVEGKSGVLSISPQEQRPEWFPSRRSLIWPNGVIGRCYSASDPEQLRGPEHHFAWCDEIAKWKSPEAWDNLMLGMRIGHHPQTMATTTPRSKQWLIDLIAETGVIVNHGRTQDNQANLATSFLTAVEARFGKTALAQQELDGVLITSHPDALWQRDALAGLIKMPPKRDEMAEVIIAVDPAVGGGDETYDTTTRGFGIGYAINDKTNVAVNLVNSEDDTSKNELETLVIAFDYTIAPGLNFAIALNNSDYTEDGNAVNNMETEEIRASIQANF